MVNDDTPLIGSDGMGYVPYVRTTKEGAQKVVDELNKAVSWETLQEWNRESE